MRRHSIFVMSSTSLTCLYCAKECKESDSKPYPNSKSKDRIHNRCYIKKSLADKQAKSIGSSEKNCAPIPCVSGLSSDLKTPSLDFLRKVNEANEKLKASVRARKLTNMIENPEQQSFFFDIKAGIAKAHEKRRFLNHRKICEMAPRYDDHGFMQDAVGRCYDSTGKDLNTLGDDSDSDEDRDRPKLKVNPTSTKRMLDSNESCDELPLSKKPNSKIDMSNRSCWFCLSSPNVEKHLIVSIGTHCYLSLAKGGLIDEHFLLIPIEHIGSVNAKENSRELVAEKNTFMHHIMEYFETKSMGVVFFERNFRSVHWQIHAVPIARKLLRGVDKKIREVSDVHYSKCTYIDFASSLQISDIIQPGAPYLHWQIEPLGVNFACVIDVKESFFPVQLPRIVLAQILDCPDRIDWKKCCKSREEYLELVAQIKEKWTKFDVG